MKKSLFVLLLSLCVLAGGAQVDVKEYSPKLTASTVNLMEKAVVTRTLSPEQTVNVFIRLADGADIERIGRIYGVKFNVGTGNLYTAVVPMSMLAALADDDGVEAVDAGQEVHMMMDAARRLTHVDEAHAFGVRGRRGLGVCEEQGVTGDVDFIVGTFGKAVNSVGAFVACNETAATYLVNKARTLIFTTALPPVCWQWTLFVLRRMADFGERRNRLKELWQRFKSIDSRVASHIIPVIVGSSEDAVRKASELRQNGFYVLPVRPPSVPEGTSRLRISLTAGIEDEEMYRLITLLKEA